MVMSRRWRENLRPILILNNDAHAPADFVGSEMAKNIARGAGLNDDEISAMFENSRRMVKKLQV